MEDSAKPAPPEFIFYINYHKYGAKSILGRDVLSYGEINRMNYIDILINAINNPQRLENMPQWAKNNPTDFRLYTEAKRLAYPKDEC